MATTDPIKDWLRPRVDRRRFGRVRWVRKARELRSRGVPVHRELKYLFTDPEVDNFTYDLANEQELAEWLADVFGVSPQQSAALLAEARANEWLATAVREGAASRPWSMKGTPDLGRRLGWYALVRLLKPRRVIETGTHDGLGSLVLLAALDRNVQEGAVEGKLVSIDRDPHAGWMVGAHPRFERVTGAAEEVLGTVLAEPADILLHDSDHSYRHEWFELSLAADSGVPTLISDNSHVTAALRDLCEQRGGRFEFFRESPKDHFYAGSGIGLGLLPNRSD